MVDGYDWDTPYDQDYTWAEELLAVASDPKPSAFKLVFTDEFHLAPEPKWQIEGLTQRHVLHLNYGQFGAIKTFYMLEIAAAIVTGLPAFGHFPVYERGEL